MTTVLRYTLRRFRGQMLGWGIGLALLGVLLVSLYEPFASQQEQMEAFLEVYPEEFTAFFGDFASFTTPEGFLSIEFFSYMPLILGIFAVLGGSGLLVSDEENGTLDLVMSYPVSRTALFAGRFLAFGFTTIAILAISWVGLALPMTWTTMDLPWESTLRPMVDLLLQMLLFGNLCLLLSLLLPSRRMAAMSGGILLVASFFIPGFANINQDLEPFARFSPLYYYKPQEAFDGLNGEWILGLFIAALVFVLLAWWLFLRRDIRVGGEGGWRLPWGRK